jgi:hypothetical protein
MIEYLSELPKDVLEQIAANTLKLRAPEGIDNARTNLAHIQRSVMALREACPTPVDKAIVIAAGPSLHRQNLIARIKALPSRPLLVCCDASMGACLRQGLVPDIVLSLDPHAHRIVRWFGDPDLAGRPEDDYFRRQDLDIELRENERAKNEQMIRLVNEYGPRMKAALATSVPPAVLGRCVEAGMPMYWWNPLYDDWDAAQSYTREVYELTGGITCMSGLGHCGGAAWVLAQAVLGARHVGIVGMDLGYPDGTSIVNTQYYDVVRHLPREQAERLLLRLTNPHTGEAYLTDPVYYWYRHTFLDAVTRSDARTVNCSGEGTLFGEGVEWSSIEEFAAV